MSTVEPNHISPDDVSQKLRTACRESSNGLTVIFGAGASRGYSRNRHKFSPPTVTELFDDSSNAVVSEILNRASHDQIRGLKPAIERNLKSFGGNLEKYLSDIYCDNRDNNLFSLLIVYLQDLFSFASNHIDLDDNNYKSLATFLHNMRGKRPYYFLTFNYDTILEQSIENLHLYRPPREFKSALDYEAQFPVIRKIHGGINIRYELDVEVGDRLDEYEVFARMMSDSSETHSVRSPGAGIPGTVYQMKDQSTEKDFWRYNFPLMLIPVHEAVSPENGYFKKKLEQAKECISNSGLVVAIGYNFGDEQFLNAIKESITPGAELILVGTQSLANNPINHPAYQNISTVWPQERILIFTGDGFQAFTDAL